MCTFTSALGTEKRLCNVWCASTSIPAKVNAICKF